MKTIVKIDGYHFERFHGKVADRKKKENQIDLLNSNRILLVDIIEGNC